MMGKAFKTYSLAVVSTVYLLNVVDRGLVSLLSQPIKEDLGLTDTQLGFVTGIAFGLFYAVLGVPIARWADRGNRVSIVSLSIGLWGITVILTTFVASFAQLVVARIAAAVGEAGCKPPTYSLIGDYFPEHGERTRALGVYTAANYLSSLVSYGLGGWIAQHYGWRAAFLAMGVPGLLLAVLIKLSLHEPRTSRPPAAARADIPSLGTVFAILWRNRSCRHLCFAVILTFMVTFGLGPWQSAFMIRTHHLSTGELGLWLGLIISGGGTLGALIGGHVSAVRFAGRPAAQVKACAFALAMLAPFLVLFLFAANAYVALLALLPAMAILGAFLGAAYTLMQQLVADTMRATMMAVMMLLANLIGFGVGPQAIGIVSDALAPSLGADSLRYAILVMSVVPFWAAWHLFRVARTVDDDIRNTATPPPRDVVPASAAQGVAL